MEESVYEQFHNLEDSHFWFLGRRRIFLSLLEHFVVKNRTDLSILEIGCGPKGLLKYLASYGKVYGMDIAHQWLKICQDEGGQRLITGSGYALPIKRESFDIIGLFDTLEHIPDDIQVLKECRLAIKPGGYVFISVPAYQFLYSTNDRVSHHQRRYSRNELKLKLREAGIEPVHLTYFNSLLFPIILPIVLGKKFVEKYFSKRGSQSTNLSHALPPLVNNALTMIFSSESSLLKHVKFPFGHSLIAIGKKL
ncbi:MAG: class I SAM-dependent methyltransferase [Pseudomonadota bacterium]